MDKHAFVTKFAIGNTQHPGVLGLCRRCRALRVMRFVDVRGLELLATLFHALALEIPLGSRQEKGIILFGMTIRL